MSSESTETCMFFVDDSNIWIEAQKFAASGNSHMPKLTDSDHDPRLRIDIGKLINTLRKDRIQGPSFLYGSRPPPNDSVWTAFEKFKFKTKIYDRARGKEKEVDNSMATDLSSEATELSIRAEYDPAFRKKKASTMFIVVTGDRDMLPPIKKVLKSNIRVELWAWQSGISNEYLKLDSFDGLLSIHFMNSIFDKISFTNFRSTRQTKAKRIDPGQTIVLCGFANPGEDDLESLVREQLIQLGRLFYITLPKGGTEIFVEFPRVGNIEAMVLEARVLFAETLTVLSWPEYASRFNQDLPAIVETSNMYAPLTNDPSQYPADVPVKEEHEPVDRKAKSPSDIDAGVGHGKNEKTHPLNESADNDGWTTVARSDLGKEHRRGIRQTQRCSDRLRCKKRGDCGSRHSEEERNLFRQYPDLDFPLWKTKECNRVFCRLGKRCPYAHSPKEAWCPRCRREGHYTPDCRYRG